MIYLYNLSLAENTCCQPFNWAIKINFPDLYRQGYRVGFYNEVPQRQEDVSPVDRMQNAYNQSMQSFNHQMSQINTRLIQIEKEISK